MADYKQQIWEWFKQNTELPEVSIAAIMGNLECESNCEACRKQGDFSTSRILSQQYAEAVDNGTKSAEAFSKDSIGWGLAQWTYYTRKANLLSFAKGGGKSIADLNTQLGFLVTEMQNEYKAVWNVLMNATDIQTGCDKVCNSYEQPAVNNYEARRSAAKAIYDKYKGSVAEKTPVIETPAVTDREQIKAKIIELLNQL